MRDCCKSPRECVRCYRWVECNPDVFHRERIVDQINEEERQREKAERKRKREEAKLASAFSCPWTLPAKARKLIWGQGFFDIIDPFLSIIFILCIVVLTGLFVYLIWSLIWG